MLFVEAMGVVAQIDLSLKLNRPITKLIQVKLVKISDTLCL